MTKNIIFLPGMLCDERVFSPQMEFFKECRKEVADLSKFNSLEKLAESVLEKTLFSNFILCGLSMGGILAMEMIKQAQDRIEGIILIDTNHLADREERRLIREQQLKKINQGQFESIIINELKPFYLKENLSSKAKKLKKLFYQMAMNLGEQVFINQTVALRDRQSYEWVLKVWGKPALIICGEDDVLCPPERHVAMKKLLSNGELQIIKNAGHISNLETPIQVNEIIENWLHKLV